MADSNTSLKDMTPQQRQDFIEDHAEKSVANVWNRTFKHSPTTPTPRVTTGTSEYLRTADGQSVRAEGGPNGAGFNAMVSKVKAEMEPLVEKVLERVNQISAKESLEGKALIQSIIAGGPLVEGQRSLGNGLNSLKYEPTSSEALFTLSQAAYDAKSVLAARGMTDSDAYIALTVTAKEAGTAIFLANTAAALKNASNSYSGLSDNEIAAALEKLGDKGYSDLQDVSKELAKTWGDNPGSRALNEAVTAGAYGKYDLFAEMLNEANTAVHGMLEKQSQVLQKTTEASLTAYEGISEPLRAQLDKNAERLSEMANLDVSNHDLPDQLVKTQAMALAVGREMTAPELGKPLEPEPFPYPQFEKATSELRAAIHSHLEQSGYDTEALARSGEMATAVEKVLDTPPLEPSMLVFGREGEALLSLTSEADKVAANETAISLDTLSYVKENGRQPAVVEAVRDFVPEATKAMSDLQVADAVGPQFIERTHTEGFPRETLNAVAETMQRAQDGQSVPTEDTKVAALSTVVEPFSKGMSHEDTLAAAKSDIQAAQQQQSQQKLEKNESQASAEMAVAM